MRFIFQSSCLACTSAFHTIWHVTVRGTVFEEGSNYPLEYATISLQIHKEKLQPAASPTKTNIFN